MELPIWDLPPMSALPQRSLRRPVHELNTGWEDVLVPHGLALVGQAFDDCPTLAWAREWAHHHLSMPNHRQTEETCVPQLSGEPTRGVLLSPYCGEWGVAMPLAALAIHDDLQRDERLLGAIRSVADYICDEAIRVDDVLVHAPWYRLAFVDTLYYAAGPLVGAYATLRDERYAREAVAQCLQHAKYLRDERSGCFFHEADPRSGRRTSWLWSRGNGWVAMALADTLRHCPDTVPGWDEVLELYRSLVTGLLRYQHACGLWRIVPEVEESHLETSGSIMIATGITVGIAEGWLDRSLGDAVMRTWWETLTWVDDLGQLQGCQTPAGFGGWEQHKKSALSERTYGSGSLLRFVAELRIADLL